MRGIGFLQCLIGVVPCFYVVSFVGYLVVLAVLVWVSKVSQRTLLYFVMVVAAAVLYRIM